MLGGVQNWFYILQTVSVVGILVWMLSKWELINIEYKKFNSCDPGFKLSCIEREKRRDRVQNKSAKHGCDDILVDSIKSVKT